MIRDLAWACSGLFIFTAGRIRTCDSNRSANDSNVKIFHTKMSGKRPWGWMLLETVTLHGNEDLKKRFERDREGLEVAVDLRLLGQDL